MHSMDSIAIILVIYVFIMPATIMVVLFVGCMEEIICVYN